MKNISKFIDPDYWARQGIKDALITSPMKGIHKPENWMHAENHEAYLKAYQLESARLLILRE